MSGEREAFETWLTDPNYFYSDRDRDIMFWAWQASRKVAIEDSANVCLNMQSGWNSDDQEACALAIRNLK